METPAKTYRASRSGSNGAWTVEHWVGAIAAPTGWIAIATCGPDQGSTDHAVGYDAGAMAGRMADAMNATEGRLPTTGYAPLAANGDLRMDGIRDSIEDCCHDSGTDRVAQVEVRIVRVYESEEDRRQKALRRTLRLSVALRQVYAPMLRTEPSIVFDPDGSVTLFGADRKIDLSPAEMAAFERGLDSVPAMPATNGV